MPVAPPAVIMPAPLVPSSFRLEKLGETAASANVVFLRGDCSPSEDGTIVVCARIRLAAPEFRSVLDLPPPPLEDPKEPLMLKRGNLEFGAGPKGIGLRVGF
jgi:hypothetical protein